ncbi:MAG TPA: serine hydrolase [Deinococcales bacterium]|nr:serine hydrolase [Deinococcales bacterium]
MPLFDRKPRRVGRKLLALLVLGVGASSAWRAVRGHDGAGAESLPNAVINLKPALRDCVAPARGTVAFQPNVPPEITGRVGLFVARLAPGTGFQPVASVSVNGTSVFPLASSFKPSVLWAYLKAVDAGKATMAETFDVTGANQSLGDYPFDHSNARQLAERMIQFSDNTATDILFRRVGLGALQPLADRLGLCSTRLQLPTKDWWAAESGLTSAFPTAQLAARAAAFGRATPIERLDLARHLDAEAQDLDTETMRKALDPYFEGRRFDPGEMADIDLNLQNASTPEEWARFLAGAFAPGALSGSSRAVFREVMALGYGRSRVRHAFAYFGGKEGNTSHILTLCGYLEKADGTRLVYAFFNDRNAEIDTFHLAPSAFRVINAALDAVDPAP